MSVLLLKSGFAGELSEGIAPVVTLLAPADASFSVAVVDGKTLPR